MPVMSEIAKLAVCPPEGGQSNVKVIDQAALAWEGDTIRWVGALRDLPAQYSSWERHSAGGKIVIPGLIDCHTHLAFGGWRAGEFEMRLLGRSYSEIAEAGGGIATTVAATREAFEDELCSRALSHLEKMQSLGVTAVECKSGYGLTLEDELKLLRVYERLKHLQPLAIVSTFLGAHTVPTEWKSDRAKYISIIVDQMIPEVAREKLAVFCDVFIEGGAFTLTEGRAIIEAARREGMLPKLHVDQLSSGGGAELAADLGAISADHLECISDAGISALKASGTVAVTLPLSSLYTFQQPLNARRLIAAGVAVAVATDFNPGTAPSYHLPMTMMLACTLNRMTPAEVLKGATIYAAKAIGQEKLIGSLEEGKQADFAIIDAESIEHWLYHFQANACLRTVKSGEIIHCSGEVCGTK